MFNPAAMPMLESCQSLFAAIRLNGAELSHADPVVPILIASIFITMGAALGGLFMRWLKQPAVLGELLVGLAAGNLGYYFANPTLTVLREGDNLSHIAR